MDDRWRQLTIRGGRRPGNKISLRTRDAQITDKSEVFTTFDSLCDNRCMADLGEILHGANEVVFHPVIGDSMDEMFVYLDELGPHFRPHAQVGKTFTEIVDGNLEAAPAKMQQPFMYPGQIGDLLILGQLDDHPIRGNSQVVQQTTGLAVHQALVKKAAWRHVEKQPPGQAKASKGPQAGLAAGVFECAGESRTSGRGKQLVRTMQGRTGRPADQRLEPQVGLRPKIENGLKDRV